MSHPNPYLFQISMLV